LIHAKIYVEESWSIPWRGYLLASSHKSCKNNSIIYQYSKSDENSSYYFAE
jgi:hypothetical protein